MSIYLPEGTGLSAPIVKVAGVCYHFTATVEHSVDPVTVTDSYTNCLECMGISSSASSASSSSSSSRSSSSSSSRSSSSSSSRSSSSSSSKSSSSRSSSSSSSRSSSRSSSSSSNLPFADKYVSCSTDYIGVGGGIHSGVSDGFTPRDMGPNVLTARYNSVLGHTWLSGPYVASPTSSRLSGYFDSAGTVPETGMPRYSRYVACFVGEPFTSTGTFVSLGVTFDGTAYDAAFDASGNAYLGGAFTTPATRVCKVAYAGGVFTFSALGSGVNGTVYALATASDGSLYAGGSFTTAGGVSANYIAKWDGANWSALGSGMNGTVRALFVTPAGILYAGGDFTTAGGTTVNYIAKWNGSTWSSMPGTLRTGLSTLNPSNIVNRFAYNAATGKLYVGGGINGDGNQNGQWNLAIWDTTTNLWTAPVPSGTTFGVTPDVTGMSIGGGYLYITMGDANPSAQYRDSRSASWIGTSYGKVRLDLSTNYFYELPGTSFQGDYSFSIRMQDIVAHADGAYDLVGRWYSYANDWMKSGIIRYNAYRTLYLPTGSGATYPVIRVNGHCYYFSATVQAAPDTAAYTGPYYATCSQCT